MDQPVEPVVFIRDFLAGFLENQLVNAFITPDEYHDHLFNLRRDKRIAAISRRLFENSPQPVLVQKYGCLRVVFLREPDGGEFPFLQGLTRSSPLERNLVCFVGHRFSRNIERSLRFNLVHLFEPHRITLRWSGYDLTARDVFEDVVTGIREADLCLFDNQGTLNKPNVYIEIGIAHALGKPMLVSEYMGDGEVGAPDTGSVPSDLKGLMRIQYQSYQDLCRQLYFGLPSFLHRHNFL